MSDKDVAKHMMHDMSDGKEVTIQYNQLPPDQQKAVYAEMKQLKDNDVSKEFGNLTLTGTEDGRLADAQRTKGTMERIGSLGFGSKTQDVYDSPADIQAKLDANQRALTKFVGAGGVGTGMVQDAGLKLANHKGETDRAQKDQ